MRPLLELCFCRALDALFPPRCAGCFAFCRAPFCARCAPTARVPLPPFCRVCGHPFDPGAFHDALCADCREAKSNFDCARAAFLFEGAPRLAIHRFKYNGKSALGERLAPFLHRVLERDETLRDLRFDYIAPVPLHARRERKRGFNQSEVLARALAPSINVAFAHALVRTRPTTPQVGLRAKERVNNVRGAFSVAPKFELPTGAFVLLVDDVFTTGATLRECAKVLRRAGAATVCAVTLARQNALDLHSRFEEDTALLDDLILSSIYMRGRKN